MIVANGLSKRFGEKYAIKDLSFETSGILGLVGPNGAGKTTTMRILATLMSPTSGWFEIEGTRDPREIRRLIGYVPESPGFYEGLSAKENIEYYARLRGVDADMRLLEDFDLDPNMRVREMSRGMKQKLSLIRALLHDPEVLLLDEPMAHLDPSAKSVVEELIQGRVCVISSQNLLEIERVCDEVVMVNTTLIAHGRVEELKRMLEREGTMLIHAENGENVANLLLEFSFVRDVRGSKPIEVKLENPYANAPKIIEKLVRNGVRIVEARIESTLEEVYKKLMK